MVLITMFYFQVYENQDCSTAYHRVKFTMYGNLTIAERGIHPLRRPYGGAELLTATKLVCVNKSNTLYCCVS